MRTTAIETLVMAAVIAFGSGLGTAGLTVGTVGQVEAKEKKPSKKTQKQDPTQGCADRMRRAGDSSNADYLTARLQRSGGYESMTEAERQMWEKKCEGGKQAQ